MCLDVHICLDICDKIMHLHVHIYPDIYDKTMFLDYRRCILPSCVKSRNLNYHAVNEMSALMSYKLFEFV